MNDLTQKAESHKWFKLVLFAGMLLFAFYASTHMVAAGDTWVAMACGRHFANHGVDTVEPFSFNSHKAGPSDEQLSTAGWPEWTHGIIRKVHPTGWIDQNWLTQLIFYKLATWFGDDGGYNYNTLVYWKFAIYFLAVFCVYAVGKVLGAGDFLSAVAACLAMVVGRTFFDIRPAGYSNLLVPAYILILVLATYHNYRLIWLLIPLVVFWANVHGGYLYAFIMLVPFVGVHLLLRTPQRWSISLGFIGLWLVMYMMSYKFLTNEHYLKVQEILRKEVQEPSLIRNKMLVIWVILAAISLTLTKLKNIRTAPFYAYHIGAGIIWFLSLAPRLFFAQIPQNLTKVYENIYSSFLFSSQMSFFFIFVVGSLLILAMALKKERFTALSNRGILHTIGAGVIGFIAMIIFNPFHLTNLTHTFEISVSKHAESWRQVNEWKPAFDWMDKTTTIANPVGNEEAFAVLCILTLVALLFWLIAHALKPRPLLKGGRNIQPQETPAEAFEWPKIDLAILLISLLTLYMAIKSRRFIALAGSAAAPAVFLMILQSWQMISARLSWNKEGLLKPVSLNPTVGTIVRYGTIFTVLVLGAFWGLKYKRIYLDPWPSDSRYNTVFMRMTASNLKPFEVCEFIDENKISGRVFNYWTEGGAVAFGQIPDPKTGLIPLKLFMDGRAQAAYEHKTFQLWQLIFAGGPVIQEAQTKKKKITSEILKESGQWIDSQFKQRNVWVVLLPQSQENSTFMKALKTTSNWKTGYIDSTQHLLVDAETPQGEALLNSIIQGTAVFPDNFSKNLTTANVIIETQNNEQYDNLYTLVKAAFDESPIPIAALAMQGLLRIPTFSDKIINDLKQYLDDFIQNKDTYMKESGSLKRLSTAELVAQMLITLDPQQKDLYEKYASQFNEEVLSLGPKFIW